MKLTQADLDFILLQLNLPGNDPRNGAVPFGTILDPTGIRDVQGIGNNVLHPTWGAADQLFPRLTNPAWLNAQGTFTMGQRGVEITLNPAVSYQTRDINLVDSSPRIISNFVANQSPEALSAIGYVTPGEQAHAIIDDPDATPNGRLRHLRVMSIRCLTAHT